MKPAGELLEAMGGFCENPCTSEVRPLGCGNINDTYLIKADEQTFVLQKINKDVFPDPAGIIDNFCTITEHFLEIKPTIFSITNSRPVKTLQNSFSYKSNSNNWWRGQTFIQHRSFGELQSSDQAREIGVVLATFHNLLKDLEPGKLIEPLPGFHDLRSYWTEFLQTSRTDLAKRRDDHIAYCLEIITNYRYQAMGLHRAFENDLVKRLLVHGDPKLENFMFDDVGKCLGLIDLDTVGLGFVHHDIGDCLRSCCNGVGEMGKQRATFRLDVCSEFLDGYFGQAKGLLLPEQMKYIYEGILHICFELGLRFFMDFLRGNVYFKVGEERENLKKAVRQFQLVEDVAKQEGEIRYLIKNCISTCF